MLQLAPFTGSESQSRTVAAGLLRYVEQGEHIGFQVAGITVLAVGTSEDLVADLSWDGCDLIGCSLAADGIL